MKKEEFIEKFKESPEENAELIYDLMKNMINSLENKLTQIIGQDLQQLDRSVSILEDRFDSLQTRIDNISYTMKKALQSQT